MSLRSEPRSANVVWQVGAVGREERWRALGRRGATVWFTGLPASGKSTLAAQVEARLLTHGRPAYLLDGDNLRHGLCGDLGFSASERAENVRRAAQAGRLLADAGTVALVSLVSPYAADRARARAIHAEAGLPFLEVWVDTPLGECERRDPKGLYGRARRGELRRMSGIAAPNEPPAGPEVVVRPGQDGEALVAAALDAGAPRP